MRTLMLVLSGAVMLGASVPSPAPIIIVDSCCLHPNGAPIFGLPMPSGPTTAAPKAPAPAPAPAPTKRT